MIRSCTENNFQRPIKLCFAHSFVASLCHCMEICCAQLAFMFAIQFSRLSFAVRSELRAENHSQLESIHWPRNNEVRRSRFNSRRIALHKENKQHLQLAVENFSAHHLTMINHLGLPPKNCCDARVVII